MVSCYCSINTIIADTNWCTSINKFLGVECICKYICVREDVDKIYHRICTGGDCCLCGMECDRKNNRRKVRQDQRSTSRETLAYSTMV